MRIASSPVLAAALLLVVAPLASCSCAPPPPSSGEGEGEGSAGEGEGEGSAGEGEGEGATGEGEGEGEGGASCAVATDCATDQVCEEGACVAPLIDGVGAPGCGCGAADPHDAALAALGL